MAAFHVAWVAVQLSPRGWNLERNRSLESLVLKYFSPTSLENDNCSDGLAMGIYSAFKSNKQFESLTLEYCDLENWEFNGLDKCKDLSALCISV